MKFEIKARFTNVVLFIAEIDAKYESEPHSMQLGAAVRDAYLRSADLSGAYLHDAYLHGAYLRNAYLRSADLSGAYLSDAYLSGADLSGADLRDADLRSAYLHDAYLRGADLRGADLHGADLHGADLRGADLRGAYLHGADLHGAYLHGADLRGADLHGADLHGADLHDAYLHGANTKVPRATPEQAIANLDKVAEIILAEPDRLYMDHWHDDEEWQKRTCAEEVSCGTTHCLAGWLQVCSTDPEVRKLEPFLAGVVQAPVAAKMFYRSNEEVMEWLKTRKYAEEAR